MRQVIYQLYIYGFVAAVLVGLTAGMSDALTAHVASLLAHGPLGIR